MVVRVISNTSREDLNKNISAFRNRGFTLKEAWAEGTGFVEVSPGEFQAVIFSRGMNQELIDRARATGRNLSVTYRAELEFRGEEEPFVDPTLERPRPTPKIGEARAEVLEDRARVQFSQFEEPSEVITRGRFFSPTRGFLTEQEVALLQRREARRVAQQIRRTQPGEKQFAVGLLTVTRQPTKIVEEIRLAGGERLTRITKAPEGQRFIIEKGQEVTAKTLRATTTITPQQVEAQKLKDVGKEAKEIFQKATPIQKIGIRAKTLLSPAGTELVGASVLGDVKKQQEVINRELTRTIITGEKETQAETFVRSVVEGTESPIVQAEAAFLAGGAFGAALKIPKVASAAATLPGRAAIIAPVAVETGITIGEIEQSLKVGDVSRAVGVGFTTGVSFAAAGAGFKTAAPKPKPMVARKLVGFEKVETTVGKEFTPKKVEAKLTTKEITVVKTKLAEAIRTGEIDAFVKESGLMPKFKDVEVKLSKTRVGQPKLVGKKGEKPVGLRIEEPKELFVLREVKTGRFVQFGEEVTIKTKLGFKEKIPKPKEKIITLAGEKQIGEIKVKDVSEIGEVQSAVRVVKTQLKPVGAIEDPSVKAPRKLVGRQLKGTLGVAEKAPRIQDVTTRVPSRRVGFVIERSKVIVFRPLLSTPKTIRDTKLEADVKMLEPTLKIQDASERVRVKPLPTVIQMPDLGTKQRDVQTQFRPEKFDVPETTVTPPDTKLGLRVPPDKPIVRKPPKTPPILIVPKIPGELILVEGKRVRRFGTKIIKNPIPDVPDIGKAFKKVKLAV